MTYYEVQALLAPWVRAHALLTEYNPEHLDEIMWAL